MRHEELDERRFGVTFDKIDGLRGAFWRGQIAVAVAIIGVLLSIVGWFVSRDLTLVPDLPAHAASHLFQPSAIGPPSHR